MRLRPGIRHTPSGWMTPLCYVMLCVLSFGACGRDSSGPAGLTSTAVNGSWEFTLTRTASCSPLALQGTFYATLDFYDSKDVSNTVSKWSNSKSVPDRFNLIGNTNFKTGTTELRFWQVILDTGFIMNGTLASGGTFSGTATDPIPGYKPYLSSPSCSYTVSGRKTS